MQAPEPSQDAAPQGDSITAAKEAAQSALPFVEWISQRFADIAHDLRSGQDVDALGRLDAAAGELESLFQYLTLLHDLCASMPDAGTLTQALSNYQTKLCAVVESINPALDALDLVEVADLIEHDLLAGLGEYLQIHELLAKQLEQAA